LREKGEGVLLKLEIDTTKGEEGRAYSGSSRGKKDSIVFACKKRCVVRKKPPPRKKKKKTQPNRAKLKKRTGEGEGLFRRKRMRFARCGLVKRNGGDKRGARSQG